MNKIKSFFSNLMQNKLKLVIFILLIIFIIIGIVICFQIFDLTDKNIIWTPNKVTKVEEEQEYYKLREEFSNSFTNSVRKVGQNTLDYKKLDESKDIVYTMYNVELASSNNYYDVQVNIPYINIKGDIAEEINKEINNIFGSKVNRVLKSTRKFSGIQSRLCSIFK